MSRILFITHDLYQEDNYFPLGYGYMAAILEKLGHKVKIYSQDVYHYPTEHLIKYLDNNHFDIIGIGFLAARFKETVEPLCKIVNQHKKNAWFILGGPGPSPIPEYLLQKTKADIVAIGEAEETIKEIVKAKNKKQKLEKIKGIAYWENGKINVTPRRAPITNLDLIPLPDWSLFPMKEYTSCLKPFGIKSNEKAMGLLTSRGCINRCNFCYRMEKGIRLRNIKNVVNEIKILNKKYGVTYFLMYDELFVFSKKRIIEFKELLAKNKLKIKYSCNARVDLFDKELAILLKESGCHFLNFGMESSSQKVLDIIKKRTTVEQNIKAAEITKELGIGLGLNFLWGNIGDNKDSLKKNVELIKKYNTYNQLRTIRPVTPYPGCDLYYEAIRQKKLKGPDDFFQKFKNSDLFTINFTKIPDDKYYQLLFEANKDLIIDHFEHTNGNMKEANKLIKDFNSLYFKGFTKFRGARHYNNKKSQKN